MSENTSDNNIESNNINKKSANVKAAAGLSRLSMRKPEEDVCIIYYTFVYII